MAFCRNCGAEIKDGEKFCQSCGTPVDAAGNTNKANDNDLGSKINEQLSNTPDYTSEFAAQDIADNKVMAILAYISWLVLVPLFAAKTSKFARFHSNQGIILAICELICWILFRIPIIKWFAWLAELVVFVLAVIGVVNAAKGEAKELPFVGKFNIIKWKD